VIDGFKEDQDDEPPPNGPFRDGKLWVLDGKCPTCVFRPGNKMYLREGRLDQMVATCIDDNTVIPCHETLDGPRSVCRGLYDVHRQEIVILRMAAAFGIFAFDPPPETP
jgi:hypothetical protein